MAGSKGKSGSVSDFLGDDDWMNEDDPSEEVPAGHRVATPPSAAPAAAPVEPPPVAVSPPPAAGEPPAVVMPAASDDDGTPAGEGPSVRPAEEPAAADAVEPAAAEPAWTPAPLGAWAAATRRAVAPPASVSTGWTAWLEASSAGTLASDPTVAAAWASVLPVIVAEAGSSPQDLVTAARLAFDLLGDVDAAAALLARAEGADGGALAAWVGAAAGEGARVRAWAERAGSLQGAAASEAWRAAAQGVTDPALRTRLLHAAIEADPSDVRAAELLVATPGAVDDASATLAAWAVLAAQRPPAGALAAERVLAARTFAAGDGDAALGILDRALACHGDDAGLRALAERIRSASGDHGKNAAVWRARGDAAVSASRPASAALAYTYAAEAHSAAGDADGAAAASDLAVGQGYLELGMAAVEAARAEGRIDATAHAAARLAAASGQPHHRRVAALAAEIAGGAEAGALWDAAGDDADALAGRARLAAARGEDVGASSPRRAAEAALIAARVAGDLSALVPALAALAEVAPPRTSSFALAEAALLRYATGDGAALASVALEDGPGFSAWLSSAGALAQGDRNAAAEALARTGEADDLFRAGVLARGTPAATGWLEAALALSPSLHEAERLLGELVGARRPTAFLAALSVPGLEASEAAARWLLGEDVPSPYAADSASDAGLLWAAGSGDDAAFDTAVARGLADDDAAERRLASGASAAWRLAASARTGFRLAQIHRDAEGLSTWRAGAAEDAAWADFVDVLGEASPADAAAKLGEAASWGGDAWRAAMHAAAAFADAGGNDPIEASLAAKRDQPELVREGLRRALKGGEGTAWADRFGDAVDQAVAASLSGAGAGSRWAAVGGTVGALGVVASASDADPADRAAAVAAFQPRTAEGETWRTAQLEALYSGSLLASDAAWTFYQSLAASRPTDASVQETVAQIAGLRGDVAGAVTALTAIASTAPAPADAARLQRRIGDVLASAGREAEAEAAYLSALDHVPNDLQALEGLESLARGRGDMAAVLRILQRRAHLAEGDARVAALRLVARTTEEHLDADAAIDAWREVLAAGGDATEPATRLLALAGDGPRFLDVAGWVEGVMDGAERAHLLTRMARCEIDANREEEAIAHLEAAVSGEEIDAEGANLLVGLYTQRGDLGGADRVLTAITTVAPTVDAWISLARLRVSRRGDRDGAAAAFQGALALDPANTEALTFLGAWHHDAGRLSEALPLFVARSSSIEDGVDLTDFDVRLEVATFWRRLAAMLVDAKRTDEALGAFRNVLRFNPNDAPTLEAVAPLLVAQAAWAEAGEILERLLALSGGQGEPGRIARYYQWLGEVDAANGNVERAYKRFAKATELDHTNVRAMFGVASILRERRATGDLMRVYNDIIHHATETDDLVRACVEKGELLDEMGKLDKAVKHFEQALEWAPERADVWLHVAEAGLRMDQPEAAREAVRRGLIDASTPAILVAKLQAVAWLASEALQDAVSAEAAKEASEAADPSIVAGLGSGNWASRAEALRAAVSR